MTNEPVRFEAQDIEGLMRTRGRVESHDGTWSNAAMLAVTDYLIAKQRLIDYLRRELDRVNGVASTLAAKVKALEEKRADAPRPEIPVDVLEEPADENKKHSGNES